MGAGVEQNIKVNIRAIVDGLQSVQELQKAVKHLQAQGGKKLGLDADRPAAGAFKLVSVLRELSPATDNALTRIEGLTKAAGASGLTGVFNASAAGALALGAVIVGVVGIVTKAAQAFAEYGGHIRDLQEETGLAAATLSTLDAGATLAGKSINDLIPGIDVYLRKLSEAAHGNEETAKTFKRFGIDAKEALKDPDEAVKLLLDTLGKYPNAAERLEAANELAGKSGKALARVVEEMGGDFRRFQEEARKWGVVLGEDDVAAADKLGDAVTVMGFKVKGVLFDIAKGALPELQRAIDDTNNNLNNSHDDWQEFGRNAGTVLRGLIALAQQLAYELSNAGFRKLGERGADFLLGKGSLRQDLAAEDARLRSKNEAATKPAKTTSPLPDRPGGGKGGGGGKSLLERLADLQRELENSERDVAAGLREVRIADVLDLLDREKKALERSLDERRVSYEQYYADLERIETEAIDQEILRQQQALDKIEEDRRRKIAESAADKKLKPAERLLKEQAVANEADARALPVLQKITQLERERADAVARVAADAKKTAEEYQRQIAGVKNELARFTGEGDEANRRELDERFRVVREVAAANGDQAAVAMIDALKRRLRQQGQFDDVVTQIQAIFQKIRDAEHFHQAEADTGLVSQREADERKLQAARLLRGELQRLHGELNGIAEKTKDTELIAAVNRLGVEIAVVGQHVNEAARLINDELRRGLEDTFADIITRAKTVKEAFSDLARHILALIAQMLAQKFVEKLFGNFLTTKADGGGGEGGGFSFGNFLSSLFKFSEGGEVSGPGTATSDSILARLSDGEFVVKAASVRQIGPRVLDHINSFGRLPGFAAGGLVGELPSFDLSGAGGLVQHNQFNIQNQGPKLSKANEAALERDAARAVTRGTKRAIASRK